MNEVINAEMTIEDLLKAKEACQKEPGNFTEKCLLAQSASRTLGKKVGCGWSSLFIKGDNHGISADVKTSPNTEEYVRAFDKWKQRKFSGEFPLPLPVKYTITKE